MRIDRLHVSNFRAIRDAELRLHGSFNAIAGINGAGKSTVLSAIDHLFSRYVNGVRANRTTGWLLNPNDVRRGEKVTSSSVDVVQADRNYRWEIQRMFAGPTRRVAFSGLAELRTLTSGIQESLAANPKASVPLYITYPVNRAVLDIPLRIREKVPYDQVAAFDNSPFESSRNFRKFFAWFRDREDVENETRADKRSYRDPQLQAVRSAIETLMPGFENVRVRRQPLRMLVSKHGQDFRVDDLSDGEKGLLALTGDLAKRLALANPGLTNPLRGEGVVLIDELELHLHPSWQRSVVHCLQNTFPNVQFVVTTHSPQILSELQPDQIFLLREGEIANPRRSYGRNSGEILATVMDDAARPRQVTRAFKELYRELDGATTSSVRRRIENLERLVGPDDPELTPARLELRKREVLARREKNNEGR